LAFPDKRGCFVELIRRAASGIIESTNFIQVGELQQNEVNPIIDSWLADDGKTLQPLQREELDRVASSNPNALFIRLLYPFYKKMFFFSLLLKKDMTEHQSGNLSQK
jgi:hypothetical protein